MVDELQAGDTFASAAAARIPRRFPNYYVGILESAELTGNLDTVLDQLADYLDRDIEARAKVTSALIYPAVVAVMAVVVGDRPGHLRDAEVRDVLRVASTPSSRSPRGCC